MLFRLSVILFLLATSYSSRAQTKWSLGQCIEYAVKNGVTIKQADLQTKLSAVIASQAKASIWPSVNFSGSSGYRFGLSENPTTGTLQANNFFSSGLNFSTSVTLFNWFSKRYSLQATQVQVKGVEAGIKRRKMMWCSMLTLPICKCCWQRNWLALLCFNCNKQSHS